MNKTADIIRKGNGSLDADAYKNLVGHGETRTTATTGLGFRGEVARRKALQMKKDAEQAFVTNKSILDLLITQKEETNE